MELRSIWFFCVFVLILGNVSGQTEADKVTSTTITADSVSTEILTISIDSKVTTTEKGQRPGKRGPNSQPRDDDNDGDKKDEDEEDLTTIILAITTASGYLLWILTLLIVCCVCCCKRCDSCNGERSSTSVVPTSSPPTAVAPMPTRIHSNEANLYDNGAIEKQDVRSQPNPFPEPIRHGPVYDDSPRQEFVMPMSDNEDTISETDTEKITNSEDLL